MRAAPKFRGRFLYLGLADICTMRIISVIFLLFLAGCSKSPSKVQKAASLQTWNADGQLCVVIEIPAGTNKKIEYNKVAEEFEQDVENGMPRVVDFLPYPGNYGFIPSTLMDRERGGDGDALDILVIAEHVPVGTVMFVEPVAMLELLDRGEVDNKLVAIPADIGDRSARLNNLDAFLTERPEMAALVKQWFLHYKGPNKMEFVSWKGRQEAIDEVERWRFAEPRAN